MIKQCHRVLWALILCSTYPITAAADNQLDSLTFRSDNNQATLIELYTSEGCSSCPPADRWLSGLKNDSGLWRDFVPLGFHVDYWHYLGWIDDYAKPEYSQRQRHYDRLGLVNGVYTPGLIKDGKEWRQWRRGSTIVNTEGTSVGELNITAINSSTLPNQWIVHFKPEHNHEPKRAYVALLGCDIDTQVKAGENRGKTLHHDFVVLSLADAPLKKVDGVFQASLTLPPSVHSAPKLAIAAWVTDKNDRQPIQATGGWLNGKAQ